MAAITISISECRRLIADGKTLNLIDVRTPAEFEGVHASGAWLMPLDELDPAAVAKRRARIDEPIYVICQTGGRAKKACERLSDAGMGAIVLVEGGTVAWEREGLPVERGRGRVISLERQVRIAAGALVLLGVILTWTVHAWFIGLSAFVGAGLVFAGVTDYCGMAMVLGKMPWNRAGSNREAAECTAKA